MPAGTQRFFSGLWPNSACVVTPWCGMVTLAVLMVAALAPAQSAQAYTFKALHLFCHKKGCLDGAYPSSLIMDTSGNLYGTSNSGGVDGAGTAFELVSPGKGKTDWDERVLHSFSYDNANGANPNAGMIMDGSGNLYGTANGTGDSEPGMVFELVPNADKSKWTENVLYRFCASGGACTDGAYPEAALIMDSAGNLYGTTTEGGNYSYCPTAAGCGVLFELVPNGASWTEKVLYSFCASQGCPDGGYTLPIGSSAGVIIDTSGNLYGTTPGGGSTDDCGYGAYGCGVVFKVSAKGVETVLHVFAGGSDGSYPVSSLVADNSGNFYGTAEYGGASNSGTVFKVASNGDETVLYSFTGGADGGVPLASLILDGSGNLYGTTLFGGAHNKGSVFELDTSGGETVLHSFDGRLGGFPWLDGVIMDNAGNLYGTTNQGGYHHCGQYVPTCGTVFELVNK